MYYKQQCSVIEAKQELQSDGGDINSINTEMEEPKKKKNSRYCGEK
jgi:hypothetical protein